MRGRRESETQQEVQKVGRVGERERKGGTQRGGDKQGLLV